MVDDMSKHVVGLLHEVEKRVDEAIKLQVYPQMDLRIQAKLDEFSK